MITLDFTPQRDERGKPVVKFDNPNDREVMTAYLEGNIEKPCRLVVKRKLRSITRKFQGYYFAVCCYWVAQRLTARFRNGVPGYDREIDPDFLHEFYKRKFLFEMEKPIKVYINNVLCEAVIPPSTTRLKTSNPENDAGVFTTSFYLESIRRFCAESFDLDIPDPGNPDNQRFIDHVIAEYETQKNQDDFSSHAL